MNFKPGGSAGSCLFSTLLQAVIPLSSYKAPAFQGLLPDSTLDHKSSFTEGYTPDLHLPLWLSLLPISVKLITQMSHPAPWLLSFLDLLIPHDLFFLHFTSRSSFDLCHYQKLSGLCKSKRHWLPQFLLNALVQVSTAIILQLCGDLFSIGSITFTVYQSLQCPLFCAAWGSWSLTVYTPFKHSHPQNPLIFQYRTYKTLNGSNLPFPHLSNLMLLWNTKQTFHSKFTITDL